MSLNAARPNASSISSPPFAKANRAAFDCRIRRYSAVAAVALRLGASGIILYGVSPLENHSIGADFGCQPVMSLTSSLIAVREHKAGEPVGYGGTWMSERDTRLGVVAMGYGDGYPRAAPSGTPVLVNGREVPIVGRVAMDMICVDLGPKRRIKPAIR
jgi:alanine racemase